MSPKYLRLFVVLALNFLLIGCDPERDTSWDTQRISSTDISSGISRSVSGIVIQSTTISGASLEVYDPTTGNSASVSSKAFSFNSKSSNSSGSFDVNLNLELANFNKPLIIQASGGSVSDQSEVLPLAAVIQFNDLSTTDIADSKPSFFPKFTSSGSSLNNVVLTPLSTLLAKAIENNPSKTINEIKSELSTNLAINQSFFEEDPRTSVLANQVSTAIQILTQVIHEFDSTNDALSLGNILGYYTQLESPLISINPNKKEAVEFDFEPLKDVLESRLNSTENTQLFTILESFSDFISSLAYQDSLQLGEATQSTDSKRRQVNMAIASFNNSSCLLSHSIDEIKSYINLYSADPTKPSFGFLKQYTQKVANLYKQPIEEIYNNSNDYINPSDSSLSSVSICDSLTGSSDNTFDNIEFVYQNADPSISLFTPNLIDQIADYYEANSSDSSVSREVVLDRAISELFNEITDEISFGNASVIDTLFGRLDAVLDSQFIAEQRTKIDPANQSSDLLQVDNILLLSAEVVSENIFDYFDSSYLNSNTTNEANLYLIASEAADLLIDYIYEYNLFSFVEDENFQSGIKECTNIIRYMSPTAVGSTYFDSDRTTEIQAAAEELGNSDCITRLVGILDSTIFNFVVDAGSNQSVPLGSIVNLIASSNFLDASADFEWSLESNPSESTTDFFNTEDSSNNTNTDRVSLSIDAEGEFEIKVSITVTFQGESYTAEDIVFVNTDGGVIFDCSSILNGSLLGSPATVFGDSSCDSSSDYELLHQITWDSDTSSIISGRVGIDSTSDFVINGNENLYALNDFFLNGGALEIQSNFYHTGSLILDQSSSININQEKTYFFKGPSIYFNGYSIIFSGKGTFNNVFPLLLNNQNSILNIRDNLLLEKAASSVQTNAPVILASENSAIGNLSLAGNLAVNVSDDRVLSILDKVVIPENYYLEIRNGTLRFHSPVDIYGELRSVNQEDSIAEFKRKVWIADGGTLGDGGNGGTFIFHDDLSADGDPFNFTSNNTKLYIENSSTWNLNSAGNFQGEIIVNGSNTEFTIRLLNGDFDLGSISFANSSNKLILNGNNSLTLDLGEGTFDCRNYQINDSSADITFDPAVAGAHQYDDDQNNWLSSLSCSDFSRFNGVDVVRPHVINVTSTNSDGYYKVLDEITIEVQFNEDIRVTNTPKLKLALDGTLDSTPDTRELTFDETFYLSDPTTDILRFIYVVQTGDSAADLGYSDTESFILDSGVEVVDIPGNNAVSGDSFITLPAPNSTDSLSFNKNIIVDTSSPEISSVSANNADGQYSLGQTIEITVEYNESVQITGTPQFEVNPGTSRSAIFSRTDDLQTLVFSYVIQNGDATDDLSYDDPQVIVNGTITDFAGNPAALTLPSPGDANSLFQQKDIEIDSTLGVITNVSADETNIFDGYAYYNSGDQINIEVTANKDLKISLNSTNPTLELNSNSPAPIAVFQTFDGAIMKFIYTVGPTDSTSDLEYENTSSLDFGDATITGIDDVPISSTLPSPGVTGSLSFNTNIIIDTSAPQILEVDSTTDNGDYVEGEIIDVRVEFDEPVIVTGTPKVELATANGIVRNASFDGVDGNFAIFKYTVVDGDNTNDVNYSSVDALIDGVFKDRAGNDLTSRQLPALSSLDSLAGNKDINLITNAPRVTSVFSDSDGFFGDGTNFSIFVQFSENITATTGSRLKLETGSGSDRFATYVGFSADTIEYQYTVQNGDNTDDLNYSSTSALELQSGTIISATNSITALTVLPALNDDSSLAGSNDIVLDTTDPIINSVTANVSNDTLKIGDELFITLNFSENLNVNGSDLDNRLEFADLTTDSTSFAPYESNTNDTVTYKLTIEEGDSTDDLEISAITSNSAITDLASNFADLSLSNITLGQNLSDLDIIVDGIKPYILDVTSDSSGSFGTGNNIDVRVRFSEAVSISGSPRIFLNVGQSGDNFAIFNVTNDNVVIFEYTVKGGDSTSDLEYTGTSAIDLQGAVISDLAGNEAYITLPDFGSGNSLGDNENIVIDASQPFVERVFAVSSSSVVYVSGDEIEIAVEFNEDIVYTNNTGDATLTLSINKEASFSSTVNEQLRFTYTVVDGDSTTDLDYLNVNSLNINGSTIKDSQGNTASITLPTPGSTNSLSDQSNIVIDSEGPVVTDVSLTNAGDESGIKTEGVDISIDVTFAEEVSYDVSKPPILRLDTGFDSSTDEFRLVSLSEKVGTSVLRFVYTVQDGDATNDLSYDPDNLFDTTSGNFVTDVNGVQFFNDFPAPGESGSLSANHNIILDTVAPSINFVSARQLDNSLISNETFSIGEQFLIYVRLNEMEPIGDEFVVSNLSADIEINIAGERKKAYIHSFNTSDLSLSFIYTVQEGDETTELNFYQSEDINISVGSIQDLAGLDLKTTLPDQDLADRSVVQLDGTRPTINNIFIDTDGTYGLDDSSSNSFKIIVEFDGEVAISSFNGNILFQASSDGFLERTASFEQQSVSNPERLIFDYTIQEGDNITRPFATNLNFISSGTIADVNGNVLTETQLPASSDSRSLFANSTNVIIDTTRPFVTDITTDTADGSYSSGQEITFYISFSETVTLTGTGSSGIENNIESFTRLSSSLTPNVSFEGFTNNQVVIKYTVSDGDETTELSFQNINDELGAAGYFIDSAGNFPTSSVSQVMVLPDAGESGSLSANTNIVIDAVDPTFPSGNTISTSNVTTSSVDISFEQASDTITNQADLDYIVYQSSDAGTVIVQTGDYQSPITVSGLSDNTEYFFNITVQDEVGNQSFYTEASATTLPIFNQLTKSGSSLIDSSTSTTGNQVSVSETISDLESVFFNGNLYFTWLENDLVRVSEYNSSSGSYNFIDHTSDSDQSNINYNSSSIFEKASPSLYKFDGKLFITWTEEESSGQFHQVRVSYYNSTDDTWVKLAGSDNSQANSLINNVVTQDSFTPKLIEFNSELYVSWHEDVSGSNPTIRMSKFNGNYSSPSWSEIYNLSTPLIGSTAQSTANLDLLVFEDASSTDKIYVTWREIDSTNCSLGCIRVAHTDAGATPTTTFMDDQDGTISINFSNSRVANNPRFATFNSKLYVTWNEEKNNAANTKYIRVAELNDVSTEDWNFIEKATPDNEGLKKQEFAKAEHSQLIAFNGELYLVWGENPSTDNKVFLMKYNSSDTSWSFEDGGNSYGIFNNTATDFNTSNPFIVSDGTNLFIGFNEGSFTLNHFFLFRKN